MIPCPHTCKFGCEYDQNERQPEDCFYQEIPFKKVIGVDFSTERDRTVKQRWHGEASEGHIRTHEPMGDAIPMESQP